jgi:uncharacterized protein (DUF1800 family)
MPLTDRQLIAHLLRRAGFGATQPELEFCLGLGFDATVDRLVNYESVDTAAFDASLAAQNYDLSRIDGCQSWWIYRMLHSPRPLQEKLTLFWHGHFATENRKVDRPPYMLIQNNLFRDNALGKFDELVLKVTQDPAMLVYLDGRDNGRRRPNENYARELMELFTLGIGNYTETDITEAARALTGWTIRNDRFFDNTSNHDPGTKTVLGRTGNLNGYDVCRIVCEQSACASFIARKLLRYFLTDQPNGDLVGRIAAAFRGSGLSIKAAVESILRSPEFKSEAAFRATIKSPVELMIGAMKALGVSQLPTDFRTLLRNMQQELFNPPGVEGWDGATAWLSTTTYLHRANLMNRLISGSDANRRPFIDPLAWLTAAGATANDQIVDYFANRLLEGELNPAQRQVVVDWLAPKTTATQLKRVRGAIHLLMSGPTYELN